MNDLGHTSAKRHIGDPLDRVDAAPKAMGAAEYAADHPSARAALVGQIVEAPAGPGRIVSIDARAAEAAPGVRFVMTHLNAPSQAAPSSPKDAHRFTQSHALMTSDRVPHNGAPVALVVAETLESAQLAARLLRVKIAPAPAVYAAEGDPDRAEAPGSLDGDDKADVSVGDIEAAFELSDVVLQTTCEVAGQHAAAMEPHATVAEWRDDELTLRMSIQILASARTAIARTLGVDKEKVRIRAPYIGGGFGSKLGVHNDAVLAALAAKAMGAPVRVVQSRRNLFANGPHRAATRQRIKLGAGRDGQLRAIEHHTISTMARGYAFAEAAASPTHGSYGADAIRTSHRVVPADLPRVDSMRAPGEAVGSIAYEMAIDELAEKCGVDPLSFRLANAPTAHPVSGQPYSKRRLEECLSTAACRFGWSEGAPRPGIRREGRLLVGQGLAAAIRPNHLRPAQADASIDAAGRLMLRLDMTDIGTGTYTILTQIAAETMGMRVEDVWVMLGDTHFPKTSGSGGSFGAASAGSATRDACRNLKAELIRRARGLDEWRGVNVEDFEIADGEMRAGDRSVPLGLLLDGQGAAHAAGAVEPGDAHEALAQYSYGAQFAEVAVDADVGEVRVRRMVGVFEAGRILNPKTARSQLMGGMIFGIGAALLEASDMDTRHGAFVHRDLAGYRIPVNADVPALEVEMLDSFDEHACPLGSKGVGELGVCGAAAAIANAVYDATGYRARRFPIRIEDLIHALPEQAA